MRRLPIYFVIDISESMAGKPLEYLQESLNSVIRTLRTDPEALDKAFISIIAFAGRVRTLCPLTELFAFYPPKLPLGAGTAIGAALDFTAQTLKQNTRLSSPEDKGDYKPIVYFLSDGCSTDPVEEAIQRWKTNIGRFAQLITVGIGKQADLSIFEPISEEILRLEDTRAQDFAQFVKWVTQSVKAQSRSVGLGKGTEGISLEKAEPYDLMKVIKDSQDAKAMDENFVIITGKCSQKNLPYLLKYEKEELPPEIREEFSFLPSTVYQYTYSCPLEQVYYEWSDNKNLNLNTININALIGFDNCPQCDNRYPIALCECGQIMCVAGEGATDCPSCGETQFFTAGEKDSQGFDIAKSLG